MLRRFVVLPSKVPREEVIYFLSHYMFIQIRMGLPNIIHRATDFGTTRSRDNFLSFTLKILFYIVPAVILGNYTDLFIKRQQENNTFGKNVIYYIFLQTFIVIVTQYLFLMFLSDFIGEFQATIAGGYFIVLYFGMQTNYIRMIKEYMFSI